MPSSCWVTTCSNRLGKGTKVKMFRFPHSNPERLEKWIVALGRLPRQGHCSTRSDGLLEPKDYDRICSDHFVKGRPSNNQYDLDYIPTVFKKDRIKCSEHSKRKPKQADLISHQQQANCNMNGWQKPPTTPTSTDKALWEIEQEVAGAMLLLSSGQLQEATANATVNVLHRNVGESKLKLWNTDETIEVTFRVLGNKDENFKIRRRLKQKRDELNDFQTDTDDREHSTSVLTEFKRQY